MPAHSSHILQPLDVGCFAILKRYYGEAVAEVMRSGINHIDKTDFLMLYRPTRLRTFTADNIRSSFKATGLVPYNSEYVLTQLHTLLRTPSPPPLLLQPLLWQPETPHNIGELQ
jgi:hypothetical protein